jgi:signal transduction histidine kinase
MYITLVKRNCTSPGSVKDLAYWRDDLFAGILIYLLPFCLIALLPALYLLFTTSQYIVAVVDLATVTSMAVVAFVPGIKLRKRKKIYIAIAFAFSSVQLYYGGLLGPGSLYLLIACIFSILIFPTTYRYWPAWLNTCICFLFAVAIPLNVLPWPKDSQHSLIVWVVGSCNLIFLSFLTSALIPQLFNGLQETLDKENQLKLALSIQQQSLQKALGLVQQKNNELEQFATVASHDLQEPLRMVTSFMGLLKNKYGAQLDERAHTYINFAVDGGKRMQTMISDLLQLSRTGRRDTPKEIINLGEIVKEAEQNIFKLIDENNARIIISTPLPDVKVYRGDMSRLFQNLFSNAIRFRKKETEPVIRISATEQEDCWLISVEDNGIGIEKNKFEKIFEIFSRLHAQDAYPGSGIGLAVCKKVVEQHGGNIRVDSEEGKGSTFYFSIEK